MVPVHLAASVHAYGLVNPETLDICGQQAVAPIVFRDEVLPVIHVPPDISAPVALFNPPAERVVLVCGICFIRIINSGEPVLIVECIGRDVGPICGLLRQVAVLVVFEHDAVVRGELIVRVVGVVGIVDIRCPVSNTIIAKGLQCSKRRLELIDLRHLIDIVVRILQRLRRSWATGPVDVTPYSYPISMTDVIKRKYLPRFFCRDVEKKDFLTD